MMFIQEFMNSSDACLLNSFHYYILTGNSQSNDQDVDLLGLYYHHITLPPASYSHWQLKPVCFIAATCLSYYTPAILHNSL